ncbi:MAG: hypothetical protein ACOCRK_04525 [bacterium]
MKSNLNSIDNELKTFYKKLINNSQNDIKQASIEFAENVTALLDYYVEPIFNNGKKVIAKQLDCNIEKNDFNNSEINYIKKYKKEVLLNFENTLSNAIINCFESRQSDKDFLEDITEIIVDKSIKLFKYAQLQEYINNNINKIKLLSDKNSCPVCQLRNNFEYTINDLIENFDDVFHSFCTLIIEPAIINNDQINKKINDIKKKLDIFIPELISEKEIKFVDNIIDNEIFIKKLKEKYDSNKINDIKNSLSNSMVLFKTENTILISKNSLQNIDYIITKVLIEDKLMNKDMKWWEGEYKNRQKTKYIANGVSVYSQPFVSYLAEDNYQSYFVESAIYYILKPKLLKSIDENNYKQLKENVFNNIEFTRG